MKKNGSIFREKNFFSKARVARAFFDEVYGDPRFTHPSRFVWDHWHLDGQYRQHRALAKQFLPASLYTTLKNELLAYGQENLGCHSISEPWLSYYTEGDFQDLHTDSPHGPWAYVLSLTDWTKRKFSGGDTLILRPEIMNYWANYSRDRGLETADLFDVIPPLFNQLLVFDPRVPHGVRRVSGVHDPRDGRLVVHGWFVHPEPFVVGGHTIRGLTGVLNRELPKLLDDLDLAYVGSGIVTLRVDISASGATRAVSFLTNSLTGDGRAVAAFSRVLSARLRDVKWGRAGRGSRLILPLAFD
jgi:hypothetical protein